MSIYKPKGSSLYLYDFQWKGQRFYGTTGERSERRARAVEDAIKLQVKTSSGKRRSTLDDAAQHYWENTGQYARAAAEDERNLLWLVMALGPEKGLHEIEEPHLLKALAQRRAEGDKRTQAAANSLSNARLNRVVTELYKRVYNHARKKMKVDVAEIDWSAVRLLEAEERVRELTPGEEARLFTHLRSDMHAIVRFSLATGVRLRDAVSLTRAQCDLVAGQVRFQVKSRRPGRKRLVLPVTAATTALLVEEMALHDHEQVFSYLPHNCAGQPVTDAARRPMTIGALDQQWRRMRQAADLKDFRWHDLRHTFATRFNRHAGLKATQVMLGHAKVSTTAKYAHATETDLRAGLAAIEQPISDSRNSPEIHEAKSLSC